METKENTTASRRRKTAQSANRRRAAAGTGERRRQQASNRDPAAQRAQKRVVRPPKENIPEVVYTMPKPFRKGRFLLKLVSVAAVVLALMLAVSIFFKVDTITVAGAQKYTP